MRAWFWGLPWVLHIKAPTCFLESLIVGQQHRPLELLSAVMQATTEFEVCLLPRHCRRSLGLCVTSALCPELLCTLVAL